MHQHSTHCATAVPRIHRGTKPEKHETTPGWGSKFDPNQQTPEQGFYLGTCAGSEALLSSFPPQWGKGVMAMGDQS